VCETRSLTQSLIFAWQQNDGLSSVSLVHTFLLSSFLPPPLLVRRLKQMLPSGLQVLLLEKFRSASLKVVAPFFLLNIAVFILSMNCVGPLPICRQGDPPNFSTLIGYQCAPFLGNPFSHQGYRPPNRGLHFPCSLSSLDSNVLFSLFFFLATLFRRWTVLFCSPFFSSF